MQDIGKWILAVITILTFFAGCLGSNSAPPTRFYLLNPVSYKDPVMAAKADEPALAIEIRSLRLPPYLEKPQIVTRTSQNLLEIAEYHQWAGNLKENMARVMVRNLSFLLSTPRVTMAPFQSGPHPDVRIEAEVMAFEADTKGGVTLTVQWRLFGGEKGKMLDSMISDYKQTITGSGSKMENIVAAMNDVLGQFCHTLAQAVTVQAQGRK